MRAACFFHGHEFRTRYGNMTEARELTVIPPQPIVMTECARCEKAFPISPYVGSYTVTLIPPARALAEEEGT